MEHEKVILAKNILTKNFAGDKIFYLNICGVQIVFYYSGESKDQVINFFENYYQDFDKKNKEIPDIEIFYTRPNEKYGQSSWIYWNDWPHEISLIKDEHEENFNIIIERDFVAKVNKDGSRLYALGPELTRGTCDTIDNLLSYALGRKLLAYNAIILHAACVVKNNQAFVFFGASGAGKSTLAEQCYNIDQLKVISSDQMIIQYRDNKLYAHLMPTTIPEFPLEHKSRYKFSIEVAALIHLTQNNGDFQFSTLSDGDFLKFFLKELVFRSEFGNAHQVLELSLNILRVKSIMKGEMSYPLGTSFWKKLENSFNI